MKYLKQAPLFLLIVGTAILLTVIAVAGKGNIYKEQNYDPVKQPILSLVFTGMNEEIYPWQMFDMTAKETTAVVEEEVPEVISSETPSPTAELTEASSVAAAVEPTMEPTLEPYVRPTPMRESTQEEYKNHISADIYGDVGTQRAAQYEFRTVDESYFDDALFIGDSRTVGLHDYTDLSDHADFLCETSLTIYKVMEESFPGQGTVEEMLSKEEYGKIYLMVGINELGRGTTEDYMTKYTEVVDKLHELEPNAIIFVQGVMRVTGEKGENDVIFNNNNINARNNAIATLADNVQIFYIDMNEAVCDEEGNLNAEYTFDQIHLLGKYNDLWKQFLLSHGVTEN